MIDPDAEIRWLDIAECAQCGTLFVDPTKHQRFHDQVTQAQERAERALGEASAALERVARPENG